MRSATATPSSSPLCASIGPRTTSPIAQTLPRLVRQSSSTATKPRSSSARPTASPFATTSIFAPRTIFKPCFVNVFCASAATCASTAPRKVGSASSTVTSAPRRRHTEPISSPITPDPTMPSVFGTAPIASAPSLERMFFSSNGAPGSGRAFEPVATMTCFAFSVSPLAPETATCHRPPSPRPANEPRPWKKATLFFLKR